MRADELPKAKDHSYEEQAQKNNGNDDSWLRVPVFQIVETNAEQEQGPRENGEQYKRDCRSSPQVQPRLSLARVRPSSAHAARPRNCLVAGGRV